LGKPGGREYKIASALKHPPLNQWESPETPPDWQEADGFRNPVSRNLAHLKNQQI
jgi:hypothetical protein